jgi:hypothetical protein
MRQLSDGVRAILYFDARGDAGLTRAWIMIAIGAALALLFGFAMTTYYDRKGHKPVEQEKTAKFNALLTNAVIFHNALDIAEIVRQLEGEGDVVDPEDLAHISPYLTEHIRRFGEYSTHELGIQPEAYDPHLDVDFSPLRGDDRAGADGYGQAA